MGVTSLYLLALEYLPIDFRILTSIYMLDVAVLCYGLSQKQFKRLILDSYVPDMVILFPLVVFFVFQSFFSIQLP